MFQAHIKNYSEQVVKDQQQQQEDPEFPSITVV
jgi:hypothetical protein